MAKMLLFTACSHECQEGKLWAVSKYVRLCLRLLRLNKTDHMLPIERRFKIKET